MNHSRREFMKTIAVAAALAASGASAAEKKREMETMPTVHDAAANDSLPDRHVITIPTVDISGAANADDFKRHVVLASGTDGADWQHPYMLLMPDGRTIFAVWTAGHGGPCGPLKRSDDGGSTWSESLAVPESWSSVRNCPTIHRLVDREGTARLVVFARARDGSFFRSISEDGGRTWSPMKPAGFGGVVPPMTVLPVENGKKHLAWTHSNTVLQCESTDGGLTWSKQRRVINTSRFPGAFACEPEVIRSPDGNQLLMLMRENNRRYNSLCAVSNDAGRTWSKARELPAALTGDRHTAVYAADGRLVVMFRNRRPVPQSEANGTKAGRPVWSGPTTAWVGRYADVIEGREGQYRVTLLPYGGYGKLERLPGGTILAVSYCRYRPDDEASSIVLTRFRPAELDKRLAERGVDRRIAENVLLYQRQTGGWPKNYDRKQELTEAQRINVLKDKPKNDSMIDNGATHTEIRLLADAFQKTRDERFKEAALRGIRYLLEGQYDNGGWPQQFPSPGGYARYITFNDNAVIGVMSLLRDVARDNEVFSFVPEDVHDRCQKAVERGLQCILKCQIRVDGKLTVWCAQHDQVTFEPRKARSYELASLSGGESVGVVRFLMQIEDPSDEVIRAIEGAVAWFERSRLEGIKLVRAEDAAKPKGYDHVVVADPTAPPMWARFYDVQTNQPIFCSRDGIPRRTLAEISYERRNGYSWLGYYAQGLLERDLPAWKHRRRRD